MGTLLFYLELKTKAVKLHIYQYNREKHAWFHSKYVPK